MPGGSGVDLIRTVQTQYGERIKIIVMSGHASHKIERNRADGSSFPFLKKPLEVETLLEVVASATEGRE